MSGSRDDRAACRDMMRDERRTLRALLGDLTTEQWQQGSLCAGWSVRDLVAHLVGWDDLLLYRSRRGHAVALLRFGVRLEATDVEWARGRGRVMRMSGEEILMSLAGRGQ